jgi:hypothetical protein
VRWLRALVLGLSALTTVAAGCGGEDLPPLEGGEELSLPTHSASDDGPAALIAGTVEFDEGTGCVFLVSYDEPVGIVWPENTRATRNPFRIVLADGRENHEGDHVEGSGGGDPGGVTAACSDIVTRADSFNWHEDLRIREASDR